MPLGMPGRPPEPLYVFRMAFALALAATIGAAAGLIWHSVGGEPEDVQTTTAAEPS